MGISIEAIEAALSALYPNGPGEFARGAWESTIKIILEAAAPHMLATAWDDGFNGGISGYWPEDNPYRSES